MKYHGRGYRRTVVVCQVIVGAVYLLGRPWVGVSTEEAALRLAVFILIVGVGGAWLALWPGLRWDEQGVTLVYALRHKRVSWADLTQMEWRPRGSMGKCLVLHTKSERAIRVPTIMKVEGTDWWARLWESNLLRSRARPTEELDARAALEMTWAAAKAA
jgi:hypothetical protein